jgi:membrane protein DedA with SNARE-associated domain
MGIKGDIIARMEIEMRKHATRILFVAKLTLSLMIPALIAAGLVKAPWKRWFPAIFSGEMIWTGSLVLIGFYATEAIKRVEMGVEYAALGGTIIFVLFLVVMGRKVVKQWYESNLEPEKKD